jgi:chaperonin GroEL
MKTIKGMSSDALLEVAEIILTVIGSTYGPRGRTVALEKAIGPTVITKDGITAAKALRFDEPQHQGIYEVLRGAAVATSSATGDGTTTTMILAASMLKEAVKLVDSGWHRVDVAAAVRQLGVDTTRYLKDNSVEVDNPELLYSIASNAANGDVAAAFLTVDALKAAGAKGTVKLDVSRGVKSYVSSTKGFSVDCRPLVAGILKDKRAVELKDVSIVLCDYTLQTFEEVQGLIEDVAKFGDTVVLMAEGLTGQALEAVALNFHNGVPLYVISAPLFAYRMQEMLDDYRVLFDADKVHSKFRGCPLHEGMIHYGYADNVLIEARKTTFEVPRDELGLVNRVVERERTLETALEKARMDLDREWIQDRISALSGSVVTIHVGGQTELEMKELRDRLEDSIMATRKAIESGVSVGCGLAFAKCAYELEAFRKVFDGATIRVYKGSIADHPSKPIKEIHTPEVSQVYNSLLKALYAPMKKLLVGCTSHPSLIIERCLTEGLGYLPTTDEYVAYDELVYAGQADPTEVLVKATENAVSVVATLILVSATTTN